MENARKVSKHIRRIRGKYLSVYGEYGKLGFFAVHKIFKYAERFEVFGEYAEGIYVYIKKKQRDS